MGRRWIDVSGQKFNRLTAIRPTFNKNKDGGILWIFRCDCGKEKEINASKVKASAIKSCGCLISETSKESIKKLHKLNRLKFGESAFNALYQSYKKAAKKRKIIFKISRYRFKELIKGNCYYCGIEPYQKLQLTSSYGYVIYNGIDRKDNNLGYINGNIVSCCGKCNYSKFKYSDYEFLEWIKRVYFHNFGDKNE